MVSSPLLLSELERVLAYPKLAGAFADPAGLVARIRMVTELVEPALTLTVVTDDADNRVLEAAVASRVEAIVTGDRGLLILEEYDGIPIMKAAAFLEWRATAEGR